MADDSKNEKENKNEKWSVSGNKYYLKPVPTILEKLEPEIYSLQWDSDISSFFLYHIQKEFEFPYKVYGFDGEFIDRIPKTFYNTTSNLGILLAGLKGTGKTVTAKHICNKMNLPVIIMSKAYQDVPHFLSQIRQDVVLFIDEYEKLFRNHKELETEFLSVMDGCNNNGFRRIFLLTMNEIIVDVNLLNRPSRIRYRKTYTDLSREIIEEVVTDTLKYPAMFESVVSFISKLDMITIDLIKSVVAEVNIHNEDPALFKDIFNCSLMEEKHYVYRVDDEGKSTRLGLFTIRPNIFDENAINDEFMAGHRWLGFIQRVVDKTTIVTKDNGDVIRTYTVEPHTPFHRAFEQSDEKELKKK